MSFSSTGGPEEESTLDRTHESISSQSSYQRAMTPNPEPTSTVDLSSSHPRARSVTPSSYESSKRAIASPSPTMSEHSRQESFILAMSSNKADKSRHLKLGGQSSATPGPMTPVAGQFGTKDSAFHPAKQAGDSYADYTLSTSDQYRRPTLSGFQPEDLPLTPNLKSDSPRKDVALKKGREPSKVDVIRYPGSNANYIYHHSDGSQVSQSSNGSTRTVTSYQGSNPSHIRHRTMSQGRDEAYASDSSSYDGPSQHTIVKPNAEPQGSYSHSHTPVQSGLATLPRKKKGSSLPSHGQQDSVASSDTLTRQGSIGNLMMAQDPRLMSTMADPSRLTPTRDHIGLPPSVPGNRHVGTDQMDGNGKKMSDLDKKSKKSKKESKKGDKKKGKSLSDTGTIEDYQQSVNLVKAMNQVNIKPTEDESEQNRSYINRNMVAHVLRNQGLQRQPSTHSTTSQASSSSIDSDGIMGRLLASKRSDGSGSHTDVSFDNVSLGSHKDSGYGSSDRNSSSSTGSGTIDPQAQYFLSKSMVVPRYWNPQVNI